MQIDCCSHFRRKEGDTADTATGTFLLLFCEQKQAICLLRRRNQGGSGIEEVMASILPAALPPFPSPSPSPAVRGARPRAVYLELSNWPKELFINKRALLRHQDFALHLNGAFP